MRGATTQHSATRVFIVSVMIIAAIIFMGAFREFPNSIGNNIRGDDYIRAFYSSQQKKFPFSSLLKKDFTLVEISELAQCQEYAKGVMPIPSPTDFAHLLNFANFIVGGSRSWVGLEDQRQKNVEIKISEGKGRGVFVKRDVKKHEIIFEDVTACFGPTDYRKYLLYISTYSKPLVCDILLWAYSFSFSDCPDGETKICVEVGGSGLINDNRIDPNTIGNDVSESVREKNESCDDDQRSQHRLVSLSEISTQVLTASRDIKAGEELDMDYGSFDEGIITGEDKFEKLGLGRWETYYHKMFEEYVVISSSSTSS